MTKAKAKAKATGTDDVSVIGLVKEAIAAQNKLMAMLGQELGAGTVSKSGTAKAADATLSFLQESCEKGSKTQRGNQRYTGTADMLPPNMPVDFILGKNGVSVVLPGYPKVVAQGGELAQVK